MAEGLYGHNRDTKNQQGWNVVPPKILPDPAAKGRVNLDPFAFDAQIKQQGTRICVYRTLLCPNVKSVDSAEHNIDCTVCSGSGFLDVDPLETVGMFQSQSIRNLVQIEGFVDANLIRITLPLGVELTYFTLVKLLDFTEDFYQRVMRTPGSDVDVLKYSACRINVLIDASGQRYHQDTDFKIDTNGNVLWITGAGLLRPADGTPFSIHYQSKIQFRAVRAFHTNRFIRHTTPDRQIEHLKGPESWLIAKEFLVKRRDLDGNELNQGPFDQHVIVP